MPDPVYSTSAVITLLCLFFLFQKADSFSGYKMFYLFSLFFFGIAPASYYTYEVAFFGARKLLASEYLIMNLIVIAILILYSVFYKILYSHIKNFRCIYYEKRAISDWYFLLLSFLFLINKSLLFTGFSFNNYFIRIGLPVIQDEKTFIQSIVSVVLTTTPAVLFLQLVILWYKDFTLNRLLILAMLLLSVFPTSLPRAAAAVYFIPVLFILYKRLFLKNYFVIIFIVGFTYIFPFLDQFRRLTRISDVRFGVNVLDNFKTAHFDSYYNFALIVNDIPIQWGKQLLGTLLFFIPRVVWEDKPVGSGAFMAQNLDMSFTNLSANFFAEGYINFGYIGILIFLIILAYCTVIIDKIGFKSYMENPPIFIFYLQIILLLFYILRGDLMSSFSFLVAIVTINIIIIHLLYKRTTKQI